MDCVNELGGHEDVAEMAAASGKDVACWVGGGAGEGDRVDSVEGVVCRGGSRGIVLGLECKGRSIETHVQLGRWLLLLLVGRRPDLSREE